MRDDLDPVVFDQAGGLERGRAHGELWRAEIHELAAIRLELCLRRGRFDDAAHLLEVAGLHLPPLLAESPELHDELLGIAQGADLGVERLIVLNHYAGLCAQTRDKVVAPMTTDGDEAAFDNDTEGGTSIYTHGVDGPLLGQTWDTHASAEPFVRTMAVRSPEGARETLCLTLTGCLGIAGLGPAGVAVTTNPLACTDVEPGFIAPAVVRRLLEATDADMALARLRGARLGGAYHYMIADGRRFYGVECSGALKVLTQKGGRAAHLHTNHCFDPVLRQRERVSPHSSTFARLEMATTLYAQHRPTSRDALWELLGSHEGHRGSLCSHRGDAARQPSSLVTCGRILMQPLHGAMRVSRGCSHAGQALDMCLSGIDSRTSGLVVS